jgi:hypothetical protein
MFFPKAVGPQTCDNVSIFESVADPDPFDADPDPAFHFDPDPDFQFDTDPDPYCFK